LLVFGTRRLSPRLGLVVLVAAPLLWVVPERVTPPPPPPTHSSSQQLTHPRLQLPHNGFDSTSHSTISSSRIEHRPPLVDRTGSLWTPFDAESRRSGTGTGEGFPWASKSALAFKLVKAHTSRPDNDPTTLICRSQTGARTSSVRTHRSRQVLCTRKRTIWFAVWCQLRGISR
jgi:hypothetical protein